MRGLVSWSLRKESWVRWGEGVVRGAEESGGRLTVEVGGEGVAESSAGSCEVVAGEGSGVGGRHDARVGEQRSVGGVGLGREHVEADAGEVSGC